MKKNAKKTPVANEPTTPTPKAKKTPAKTPVKATKATPKAKAIKVETPVVDEPVETPETEKKTYKRVDTRQRVFDAITTALKNGVVPWHRSWKAFRPRSYVRGTLYKGINLWTTTLEQYSSPFWFTFNDLKKLAGEGFVDAEGNPIPLVKKGEKGVPIVFWKQLPIYANKNEVKNGAEPIVDRVIPLMRHTTVFNTAQINLPDTVMAEIEAAEAALVPEDPSKVFKNIEAAIAAFVKNAGPKVVHERNKAFYAPKTDTVNVPAQRNFDDAESYYSTMFHELGHSTGHDSRLKRFDPTKATVFGDADYSEEELVAEMAAAFLCDEFGIGHAVLENSAAYIAGWLKALNDDPAMLMKASGAASKAADFILGKKPATATAEA